MAEKQEKTGSPGKAAKEIKAFTNMFKGLAAIAEELEEVGDIESMARKRKAELDAIERQIEENKKALGEVEDSRLKEHDALKARREEVEADLKKTEHRRVVMEAEAQGLLKVARDEADKVRAACNLDKAAAKAEADLIVDNGRKRADEIVAEARNAAAAVQAEINAANDRLTVVRSDIAAEEIRLADLKAEINRLRSQFA